MDIKDELEIVLITYNRAECLKNSLDEILADNSPIKNCDITILNNNSTDDTAQIVEEYQKENQNLKHLINPKNIGGCANIAKAFSEFSNNKKYIWVLCDNDRYDWNNWFEIENAIENDFDLIMTRKCENNISSIFYMTNLVSGFIVKCENITETVISNMYDYVKFLFPHFALTAYIINHNKKVYVPSKDIVILGINPEHDKTFYRGVEKEDLSETKRNVFWSVGFFNCLELISDKKKRIEIIDGLRHYRKTLFDLFKSVMIKNKVFYNNYFYNLKQIYRFLSFSQKIKFIFAFLIINLSPKDYTFYEVCTKGDWLNYLEKIKEKEYIEKLKKKLKDKKILLYGAGLAFDILSENFDLSEFNFIGISDKKFETVDRNLENYKGLKVIKPAEIKNYDFDIVLFTLKLYKKIAKSFKNQGIKKKMLPIIKRNNKYIVRS